MSDPATARPPLTPEQLTPAIEPGRLKFETTAELEGEGGQLGAERALAAMRLGIRLRTPGYNVFLAGLEGRGREERIRELVRSEAGKLTTAGLEVDGKYLHPGISDSCQRLTIQPEGFQRICANTATWLASLKESYGVKNGA